MKFQEALLISLAAGSASALQSTWQQCGGQGWTGGTVCTSGNNCVFQNPWYSQCLPGTASSSSSSSTTPGTTIFYTPATSTPIASPSVSSSSSSSSSVSVAPVKPSSPSVSKSSTTSSSTFTSAAPPASSAPTSPASGTGATYKASFTHYGAGDSFGSPNCQTNTAACGFFTSPGFAAAASQNLFGVGPGAGAGPACGTCWKLTGSTDSSGNKLANAGTSIVVMVNNLCPAQGNPLCSQSSLTDTNQYGANVNFDLCSDSGASAAFFPSDVGLAVGSATQVDCSQWSGSIVH